MRIIESIRERSGRQRPPASEFFLEAKREVMLLARQGKVMSPRDAWMLAGHTTGKETLWSIAYRIGTSREVSSEEICAFLEKQFPRFTQSGLQRETWEDIHL